MENIEDDNDYKKSITKINKFLTTNHLKKILKDNKTKKNFTHVQSGGKVSCSEISDSIIEFLDKSEPFIIPLLANIFIVIGVFFEFVAYFFKGYFKKIVKIKEDLFELSHLLYLFNYFSWLKCQELSSDKFKKLANLNSTLLKKLFKTSQSFTNKIPYIGKLINNTLLQFIGTTYDIILKILAILFLPIELFYKDFKKYFTWHAKKKKYILKLKETDKKKKEKEKEKIKEDILNKYLIINVANELYKTIVTNLIQFKKSDGKTIFNLLGNILNNFVIGPLKFFSFTGKSALSLPVISTILGPFKCLFYLVKKVLFWITINIAKALHYLSIKIIDSLSFMCDKIPFTFLPPTGLIIKSSLLIVTTFTKLGTKLIEMISETKEVISNYKKLVKISPGKCHMIELPMKGIKSPTYSYWHNKGGKIQKKIQKKTNKSKKKSKWISRKSKKCKRNKKKIKKFKNF